MQSTIMQAASQKIAITPRLRTTAQVWTLNTSKHHIYSCPSLVGVKDMAPSHCLVDHAFRYRGQTAQPVLKSHRQCEVNHRNIIS